MSALHDLELVRARWRRALAREALDSGGFRLKGTVATKMPRSASPFESATTSKTRGVSVAGGTWLASANTRAASTLANSEPESATVLDTVGTLGCVAASGDRVQGPDRAYPPRARRPAAPLGWASCQNHGFPPYFWHAGPMVRRAVRDRR